MIPILFPSTATEWTTQGLGALSDTVSCKVAEERNGIFELEMQYPMSGAHFSEMQNRCIVLAIPSPYRSPQPFRIYRITKPLNGICTVYAQHISYDLSGVPLNPFTAQSAPAAMAGLQSNAEGDSPFTFWTDKSTTANFSVDVPSSTRSVLGGQTGSILDVYGGEYEWDKYTVKLHGQRGQDNGVVIRYGKNLTDIEQDRNSSNVATGIYPYWKGSDDTLVTCEPKVVPAPGTYDFTRVVPVDFSQDFEAAPTPAELQARAESYVQANKIGIPVVSISVSFVQLEQTEEYKDLALLEKCDLCDTVTVQFNRLGVDAKAEIVKTVTDVLLERYESVEIGSIRANIADTIANQQQEIQERPTTTAMQQAVSNATNWITNGKGYVVAVKDSNGNWSEILIMDTPDITTAQKVWRWNGGGFGFSSTGYNGPYTTAITQDGAIVADFITTGTLTANLIKAGVLSSLNGAASLDLTSGNAVFNGGLACETLSVKGYDETDPVLATLKVLNYSGLNVPYFAVQDGEGVACMSVSQSVSGGSPPQLTSTALAIGRSANVGTEGNIYFSASLTDVISNMAMYGAKNSQGITIPVVRLYVDAAGIGHFTLNGQEYTSKQITVNGQTYTVLAQ